MDFKSDIPALHSLQRNKLLPGILKLSDARTSVLINTEKFMVVLDNKFIFTARRISSYVRGR